VAANRIGVLPAGELAARRRLFDALEQALPVSFVAWDGVADIDAALMLPGADGSNVPADVPRLTALAEEGPAIAPPGLGEKRAPTGPAVQLAGTAPLDRRLRGQRLDDETIAGTAPLRAERGDDVLAAHDGQPVWVARADSAAVAVAPAELAEDECLRDRVRQGRFLAVTALVHFLRERCDGWRPPSVKATFLFDDPNLHWTSYGYLRYDELVRQADRHGYHVAFATVPLDGWFAHRRAVRLFRERGDRLSLVVHGNNHTHKELETTAERRAMLAQALRRIETFERRSGIPVPRIMVAPHGVCAQETAHELVPLGFEALCISRPYPWLARPPRSWLERPAGARATDTAG